jgi:3-oxoacyl-[acyl-carrier-protein] synthase-1
LQPLVLSRFCILTSLGAGQHATLTAIRDGTSGLRSCAFGDVDIPTFIGEVAGADDFALTGDLAGYDCRNNRLAAMALAQDGFESAVAVARERYGAHRIGLFLGTSTSGILDAEVAYRTRDPVTGALPSWFDYARTQNTYSLADFAARRLALAGPALVVSSACSSSAKVFATASRMIAAGLCDAAVVGGADSLCLTTLYGFRSLNLTAPTPCRPFDVARDGISIGEGASFVLLERPRDYRGGDAVALLGFGESSDAYHMSSPHPDGRGARLAMERALATSGLAAADIDYINLHGTATRVGDAAEDKAVFTLFGGDARCSSTKGQTGHTLGAAGVIETVISALGILHGIAPGTTGMRTLDPEFRSRYLSAPERLRLDRTMTNSFGFGGSNCTLVLGRAS